MSDASKTTTLKHFIGTCVNSFDADANCLIDQLPWSDVTEFARAEETAVELPMPMFLSKIHLNDELRAYIAEHDIRCLESHDNVLMIHDLEDDIHYFFI